MGGLVTLLFAGRRLPPPDGSRLGWNGSCSCGWPAGAEWLAGRVSRLDTSSASSGDNVAESGIRAARLLLAAWAMVEWRELWGMMEDIETPINAQMRAWGSRLNSRNHLGLEKTNKATLEEGTPNTPAG